MAWWAGRGAAQVYEHDASGSLVLERSVGGPSLNALAGDTGPGRAGGDDSASRILVSTATRLHRIHEEPPRTTRPLDDYFAELFRIGRPRGGFLARSARVAEELVADQREVVVLHGDLHHGNVLWFGADGWRAIDPKNVRGDRAFDFANIFCNPTAEIALLPDRLERQVEVVRQAAGLERERLLQWIVAYCGLSASWHLADGEEDPAAVPIAVGERAESAL